MATINLTSFAMNSGDFTRTLRAVGTDALSIRDQLNALVMAGFEQYQRHEDTDYLSRVYNTVAGLKGFSASKMKGFIEFHANVKLAKTKKTGASVFKKDADADFQGVRNLIFTGQKASKWYEFGAAKGDKKAFVEVDKLENLLKSAKKADKDGNGTARTREFIVDLESLISKYKGDKTLTQMIDDENADSAEQADSAE